MLTQADLGWMAAVVDLRGHVYIKSNKQRAEGSRQIVLMVESKRPGIIRRLGQLSGTKPEAFVAREMKEFMRRGCAEHCVEPHVHVNDDRTLPPVQRWTVTGIAFAVIVKGLEPYLQEDQGFPELAQEILGVTDVLGRGSGAVMATLVRLKDIGWPIPDLLHEQLKFQLGFHELAGGQK